DADDGEAVDDGTRALTQDRLGTALGAASFADDAVDAVAALDHVSGVAAPLGLEHISFPGQLPDLESLQERDGPVGLRVGPGAAAVGPLTTAELADGRTLEAGDEDVAVLDAAYAEREEIAVGDTVTVGGEELEIVGTVASTTGDDVATPSDVYLPLATAQRLADLDGQVTDLYVQVDSSAHVDAVAAAIADALPDASVSTQADLAENVTGSLATASDLVGTLGRWLGGIVLAAAFGLAILFTVSGVNRRTRELGTLKAIGWSGRRVVGQVAGESVVQGLIGGVAGLVLGVLAVWAVNLAGITLSGSSSGPAAPCRGPPLPGVTPVPARPRRPQRRRRQTCTRSTA